MAQFGLCACELLEFARIDPNVESNGEMAFVRVNRLVAERFADCPQRVAQVLVCGFFSTLRPEQADQMLARLRLALGREKTQQRDGFGGAQFESLLAPLK